MSKKVKKDERIWRKKNAAKMTMVMKRNKRRTDKMQMTKKKDTDPRQKLENDANRKEVRQTEKEKRRGREMMKK